VDFQVCDYLTNQAGEIESVYTNVFAVTKPGPQLDAYPYAKAVHDLTQRAKRFSRCTKWR
jgi:hypothetical protein